MPSRPQHLTRGGTSLRLSVPAPERVRATVTDALGREIAALWDGEVSGTTDPRVEAGALAPGADVVRVAGETVPGAKRLTIVR